MSQVGVLNTGSGAPQLETLTGNSGGAVGADGAFNINTLGTGSITIVGVPGTNTLTTQLTGLTNHAVLVGAGTATITNVGPAATAGQVLQSAGAAADPAFSTATYPLTTTISQILYSSAANVVSGLATANQGVLTTGATGIPVITALAVNGQLIIGSTAGVPAAATLTAGTGVTITNAANSITINTTGGGYTWNTIAGTSQTIAVDNAYINGNAGLTTLTLPVTATVGQAFRIAGYGAGGWTIAQNASQKIYFGASTSTVGVGGSVASTIAHNSVEVVCVVANNEWQIVDAVGNLTVT